MPEEKAMSNVDLRFIVEELKNVLLKSRVRRIYQLSNNLFTIIFYTPSQGNRELIIELGKRLHLTSHKIEKKKIAPPFSMTLRKYLNGGFLTEIKQINFDRVIQLTVTKGKESFKLIVEMFRNGNLILTDSAGQIIRALRPLKTRHREIVKGERYIPPPNEKISIISDYWIKDLLSRLKESSEMDVFGFFYKNLNLGTKEIKEIHKRASVDEKEHVNSLKDEEIDRLISSIEQLREQLFNALPGRIRGYIYLKDSKYYDFSPLQLALYQKLRRIEFNSFNEAVDSFFYSIKQVKMKKPEVEKLKRVLESQRETVRRYLAEAEAYKRKAEFASLHLDEIKEDLELLKRNETPRLTKWKVDRIKKKAVLCSNVGEILFPFDKKVTDVINELYEKSKKLKSKIEKAERQIKATIQKIKAVKSKPQLPTEPLEGILLINKWYSQYRWMYTSLNHLVVAGRNIKQNNAIVRKHMSKEDFFLHADIHGSPATVIKTDRRKITEKEVEEAAIFTASYSSAWRRGYNSVDVYFTRGEQIKVSAPSGQYLPHGSFFVKGERKYMRKVPLLLFLKIKRVNDYLQILPSTFLYKSERNDLVFKLTPNHLTKQATINFIIKEITSFYKGAVGKKLLKEIRSCLEKFVPSGSSFVTKIYP